MTAIPRVFSGLLRYDSLAFLNPAYPIVTVPASSRLLKKGVQVGNIRFRSLKPGSYWRKLCRSHKTFSPFGFADRPFWRRRA